MRSCKTWWRVCDSCTSLAKLAIAFVTPVRSYKPSWWVCDFSWICDSCAGHVKLAIGFGHQLDLAKYCEVSVTPAQDLHNLRLCLWLQLVWQNTDVFLTTVEILKNSLLRFRLLVDLIRHRNGFVTPPQVLQNWRLYAFATPVSYYKISWWVCDSYSALAILATVFATSVKSCKILW